MKQNKADAVEEKKVQDRKPKYMKTLLETAKKRQQLHERRTERKVQKEREVNFCLQSSWFSIVKFSNEILKAEGDEFADKESFVTEAYKQKMREIREQEEEEKLQDLKESIMDVTKQRDMSGFYKWVKVFLLMMPFILYRKSHGVNMFWNFTWNVYFIITIGFKP